MSDSTVDPQLRPRRRVGRFELFSEIASGGMATVHVGRVVGASDFSRIVAIKRLHPQFARDPEFCRQFLDEAQIVARIRHPNVLPTLDLIEEEGELFIVMEYVQGQTLNDLMRTARRRGEKVPLGVGLRIMCGALHGLHAAHEATDENGELMGVVHRDVSPDNVIIGTDGYPRLLDFGIARALGVHTKTKEGVVKGKLAYMTPEQVVGDPVTRRTDVFSASTVLWQVLTGKRLFKGKHVGEYTHKILNKRIAAPSAVVPTVPKKLDPIVLRGLRRDPSERWQTAERMAEALEAVGDLASQREVGKWVERLAGERLEELSRAVRDVERAPRGATPRSLPPAASPEAERQGSASLTSGDLPDLAAPGHLVASDMGSSDAALIPPRSGQPSTTPEGQAYQLPPVLRDQATAQSRAARLRVVLIAAAGVVVVTVIIVWLAARSGETDGQAALGSTAATASAAPAPATTTSSESSTAATVVPPSSTGASADAGSSAPDEDDAGAADAGTADASATDAGRKSPGATWRGKGPRTGNQGRPSGIYSRE